MGSVALGGTRSRMHRSLTTDPRRGGHGGGPLPGRPYIDIADRVLSRRGFSTLYAELATGAMAHVARQPELYIDVAAQGHGSYMAAAV